MAFGIGSINPLNIASEMSREVGLGGAFRALQAGTQVFSSIGQNVIQAVGSNLGLPQGAIDMARATFAASSGDVFGAGMNTQAAISDFVQQAGGGSSDEQGLNSVAQMVTKQLETFANDAASDAVDGKGGKGAKGKAAAGGGEDFLEALALALGKAIDEKMSQMMTVAKDIDQQTEQSNDSGGQTQPVISEMSAKLQALGQEVSLLSNALDNSIKSIGEGASTLAKKD